MPDYVGVTADVVARYFRRDGSPVRKFTRKQWERMWASKNRKDRRTKAKNRAKRKQRSCRDHRAANQLHTTYLGRARSPDRMTHQQRFELAMDVLSVRPHLWYVHHAITEGKKYGLVVDSNYRRSVRRIDKIFSNCGLESPFETARFILGIKATSSQKIGPKFAHDVTLPPHNTRTLIDKLSQDYSLVPK